MTHAQLCDRAMRWLRGRMRCNPVYAGNASCREVPDAIGWTSSYRVHGSHVVECKCSVSDFCADARKYRAFRHPSDPADSYHRHRRLSEKEALALGYVRVELPRMGDFRWFMCEPGLISSDHVAAHAPDHGLLFVEANRVRVIVEAKRREQPDYQSEIRYLRFAIINEKHLTAALLAHAGAVA